MSRRAIKKWLRDLASMIWDAIDRSIEHDITMLSAGVAFFAAFSLAPLMVVAILIAGLVLGEEAARGMVVTRLTGLLDRDMAMLLQSSLEEISHQKASGIWASLLSLGTLLYGAIKVLTAVKSALNEVWEIDERSGVKGAALGYLRGLMVLGLLGLLVILSVVLQSLVNGFSEWIDLYLSLPAWFWNLVNRGIFLLLASILVGILFQGLPDRRIPWSDIWVGALMTSLLILLGNSLVSLYLGFSSPGSPFGAAGTLAALLMWLYFSAMIFFFGAEMTHAYARCFGSLRSSVEEVDAWGHTGSPDSPAASQPGDEQE